MRYLAHGLAVSSPFALPGMSEATDEGLPALELDLYTRPSVEAAWQSRDTRHVWEGQLGDGETLAVRRDAQGAHLFALGARALFWLLADQRTLACAPSEAGIHWQRILLTKVLPNVSLLRGYEALHASAVRGPDGALVVLAPSGTGKTALALALARMGWPLLTDDILMLSRGPGGVLAHPGTPHLNLDARGELRATRGVAHVLGVLGQELWMSADSPCLEAAPVSAVCLLDRGRPGPLEVRSLPETPLALAPFMLGLGEAPGRERERFGLYCELMAGAQLLRVQAGDQASPEDLAAALLEVLGGERLPAGARP